MVESKEHDVGVGFIKVQIGNGVSRVVETFQAQNKKRKKMSTISKQMNYLTDVNLHLQLAMAILELVEIGEDSEVSL
jgi:hypothetical protein